MSKYTIEELSANKALLQEALSLRVQRQLDMAIKAITRYYEKVAATIEDGSKTTLNFKDIFNSKVSREAIKFLKDSVNFSNRPDGGADIFLHHLSNEVIQGKTNCERALTSHFFKKQDDLLDVALKHKAQFTKIIVDIDEECFWEDYIKDATKFLLSYSVREVVFADNYSWPYQKMSDKLLKHVASGESFITKIELNTPKLPCNSGWNDTALIKIIFVPELCHIQVSGNYVSLNYERFLFGDGIIQTNWAEKSDQYTTRQWQKYSTKLDAIFPLIQLSNYYQEKYLKELYNYHHYVKRILAKKISVDQKNFPLPKEALLDFSAPYSEDDEKDDTEVAISGDVTIHEAGAHSSDSDSSG